MQLYSRIVVNLLVILVTILVSRRFLPREQGGIYTPTPQRDSLSRVYSPPQQGAIGPWAKGWRKFKKFKLQGQRCTKKRTPIRNSVSVSVELEGL